MGIVSALLSRLGPWAYAVAFAVGVVSGGFAVSLWYGATVAGLERQIAEDAARAYAAGLAQAQAALEASEQERQQAEKRARTSAILLERIRNAPASDDRDLGPIARDYLERLRDADGMETGNP